MEKHHRTYCLCKFLLVFLAGFFCVSTMRADDIPFLKEKLSKIKNLNAKLDTAWNYCRIYTDQPEEAYLLQEMEHWCERAGKKGELCEIYNSLARHTYNTLQNSTPDTLLYYLHKMEDLRLNDKRSRSLLTDLNSYVCYAYIYSGMTGKALDITNDFLEQAEKDNDTYAKITANEMLGSLYENISQHKEAEHYFSLAYDLCKGHPEYDNVALQLQTELGNAYLSNGDYRELRTIVKDLKKSAKDFTRENFGFYDHIQILIHSFDAVCDIQEGKLAEAEKKIQQSKAFIIKENRNDEMFLTYTESMLLQKKGQLAEAWNLVKSDLYDSEGEYYVDHKINLLEQMGNWEEADKYRKSRMEKYADNVNLLLASQLNEMRTKYDVSNLEVRNSENRRTAAVLRARIYGFILGFMVIIAALLLYIYLRTRKDKEKILLANRTQKAFLQNMSHELRTPLNAICGFSQLLSSPDLRDLLTNEEFQEYGNIIQSNTDLLTTLVTDILTSSDIESGKYQLNLHSCSANNICRQALNTVRSRCPNNIEMNFTSDIDEGYRFTGDEMRCQQILINYLTNAIKHTKAGEIDVHATLSDKDGYITFSVTDTGEGVPAEMADKIFGRFEKLNSFAQGTGLGLNICRNLAQLMHGEVFLDTSYHHGAKFVFRHPCVA